MHFKLCSELFIVLNLFLTIGVVNWSAYSSDYKEMYRVPYKVTSCLCCGDLFKDFAPGYIGDGRKGILRAFYSTKEFEGYCSADCFICDGNHYSPKDNNL